MKLHWQILVALGLGAKRNWHIFIALILGVIVGICFPATYYPLVHKILVIVGEIFIKAIQMIVIPLVVSSIIVGIASMGNSKQLGKIGLKMVLYYTLITVAAVAIGFSVAFLVNPGVGVSGFIQASIAESVRHSFEAMQNSGHGLSQILLGMIPQNPIASLANGEMVPIMLFSIIFALALATIGDINRPIVSFFESVFATMMKITDWVMVLATPGIFALTATAVSSYGVDIFGNIGRYILTFVIGVIIQIFVTYPIILKVFSKVNVMALYRAVAEALMVAFGTASSSATLPVTIACCERRAGISNKICSFVLPLGATMNMDGTAMLQCIAIVFLTQAYGIPLDLPTIFFVGFLAIVASSTSAGIPGAGLITIALILNSLGLSHEQLVEGFAFLFALDRFTDMLRTMVNVMSDTVVAATIASNESEIDYDLLGNQDIQKETV
ncbi:MAG: dicarboxylate/amino acid:cation symporter [Candidatus Gastranaerophilales bacterium]|nr:dicarboxylate/amino acid:cation symporter [Candidatus Gastranaerophilales bacterium]